MSTDSIILHLFFSDSCVHLFDSASHDLSHSQHRKIYQITAICEIRHCARCPRVRMQMDLTIGEIRPILCEKKILDRSKDTRYRGPRIGK